MIVSLIWADSLTPTITLVLSGQLDNHMRGGNQTDQVPFYLKTDSEKEDVDSGRVKRKDEYKG